MGGGGDAGAAAKDDLRAHEFSVVLAESAGEGAVAGVARVGTGGPFPDVAEYLLEAGSGGGWGGVEVGGFEEVGLCCDGGSWRMKRFQGGMGEEFWVRAILLEEGSDAVGGVLPFELGGEAGVGPAGEGVGFEEAEVADGGFGEVVEGVEAVHGVDLPAGLGAAVAAPVEGGLPAVLAEGGPAFGEPELGAVVGVVVEEGEVFSAGDEARGERKGGEVDLVAGGFVVEGEGIEIGGVRGDADVDEAGGEVDPAKGGGDGGAGLPASVKKRGMERIGVEGVLDVGRGEFEVLLLVLEAEDDAADGFVGDRV